MEKEHSLRKSASLEGSEEDLLDEDTSSVNSHIRRVESNLESQIYLADPYFDDDDDSNQETKQLLGKGMDEHIPVSISIDNIDVLLTKRTIKSWISSFFCCYNSTFEEIGKSDAEVGITKQHVLQHIRGVVKPGQLLAILGSSGSGKTTLLNTMAGRVTSSFSFGTTTTITGHVLMNGVEVTPQEAKKIVGYVMQNDHLLPNLTARETLQYAGLLRLPASLPYKQKMKIVENVILELGLKECADTRVGGDGWHGLSGGERRRVSIGIQMLTDPSVLFLDEPTSGLDSFTANKLMKTLLAIAHKNRTVICTVHQPRSDIFQLFDSVLLLSKGQQVYFGPAKEMLTHFESIGYICPAHMNPADYFLDLVTVDVRNSEAEAFTRKRLDTLVSGFEESSLYRAMQETIDGEERKAVEEMDKYKTESIAISRNRHFGNITATTRRSLRDRIVDQRISWFFQTIILLIRSLQNTMRDKTIILARFLGAVLMGLTVGGIFYDVPDSLVGIRSRIAGIYSCVAAQPYLVMIATIVQYTAEFRVFDREYYDDMVDVLPYFIATFFTSLPFALVFPSAFGSIYYWMVGLRPELIPFLWFLLTMTLAEYVAECLGLLCAALIRDFGPSSLLGNSITTWWVMCTGFVINPDTFPIYLNWISYTSYFQFTFGALAINEFTDNSYGCPYPPDTPACSLYDGNTILAGLFLRETDFYISLALIGGIAIALRLLCLVSLYLIQHKPK